MDLHVDSSAEIAARAVGGRRSGLSGDGDWTVWSARFVGVRFRMHTLIEDFCPPIRFRDRMTRGLLQHFSHLYEFAPRPDGECVMSDELTVTASFGPLGRLAERLYLAGRMEHLVRVRLERIKAVAEGNEWRQYLSPMNNPYDGT